MNAQARLQATFPNLEEKFNWEAGTAHYWNASAASAVDQLYAHLGELERFEDLQDLENRQELAIEVMQGLINELSIQSAIDRIHAAAQSMRANP